MAKILMLIEHFVPTIGGLENSTYRLANELGKQGHHVTVFTADRLTQDADSGNLVIKSTRCGTAAFAECLISSRNPREWDASIIFGVGHDEHLTHWKAVLSPSMPPAYLKVGTDGDLMRPYVTGKLLRSFKGILCQTGAIAAEARSYGISTDRIFLISNGIDVQEWRENLQDRDGKTFFGNTKRKPCNPYYRTLCEKEGYLGSY